MGAKRIEFNVDYGLNFNSKNIKQEIERQVDSQKELIQSYFEKGGKVPFKINIDNAVDLNGNAIDPQSLKAFTQKYEKAMNAALRSMVDGFKTNMSKEISTAVSETISADMNRLFAQMGQIIVEGIQKMQSDIMSALSDVKPVSFKTEDLVDISQVKDSSGENIFDSVTESISKGAKKNAQKLKQSGAEYRLGIKELEKDIANEKKTLKDIYKEIEIRNDPTKANNYSIKVGKKTYTQDIVNQIKQDQVELESVLSDFYKTFVKQQNIIETANPSSDKFKQAETKANNISFLTQQLTSKTNMEKIIKDENAYAYIPEMYREIELSTSNFKDKTIQQLQAMTDECANKIKIWTENLNAAKEKVNSISQEIGATTQNIASAQAADKNADANKAVEISTSRTGGQKYSANVQIYPRLNQESFLRQVMDAVKECETTLSAEPVKVPITAHPETVGEFIGDIQTMLRDNPVKLFLDQSDFVNQVQTALSSANISINGNLSNVSLSGVGSLSTYDFSDEENFILNNQDDLIRRMQEELSGSAKEASTLNAQTEQVNANLDKTANTAKIVKETFKETATALVGQVDVIEDQELKILKEKIEAYQYINDLRRKPGTKGIVASGEERQLAQKKDRTDEDNVRLQALREEGTLKRKAIKNEWDSLSPTLENIKNLETSIYDNEKKISRLNYLEERVSSGLRLTSNMQQELNLLRSEKPEIENKIEAEKRSLDVNRQNLEIIKQQSSYFGQMDNKTLMEIQRAASGDQKHIKAKDLIATANTSIAAMNNRQVGSEEYLTKYEKSSKDIITNQGKHNSLLDQELQKLIKQDQLWGYISKTIKETDDPVKALSNGYQTLEEQLQKIANKKIAADAKYNRYVKEQAKIDSEYQKHVQEQASLGKKPGQKPEVVNAYDYTKYQKDIQALSLEEEKIKNQIDNQKQAYSIVTKYNQDEIAQIAKNIHEKRTLYEQDLKTEEGRLKRADALRHQDINSFNQYQAQLAQHQKRVAKQQSYNKQVAERKQELINSGLSEKEAQNKAYEVLKGTDYKTNKSLVSEYNRQFQNLEMDLQEVLRLMSQINDLNNQLSSKDISVGQIDQIKSDLSQKQQDLEVLIGRTGWQSADILAYKEYQDKLSSGSKSEVSSKTANLNQFKQDASSIRDIVNNIIKEINLAEQENKELSNSLRQAEQLAQQSKDVITAKHQKNASEVLESIKLLREERTKLQEEIEKTNNQSEIDAKSVKIGNINSNLKRLESQYNRQYGNETKLQATIDQEYSTVNKDHLHDIEIMKTKILVNEDYIASLKNMKSEQEALRIVQEPTKDELIGKNTDFANQQISTTKQYLTRIKEVKTNIQDTKAAIKEAEQVATSEIAKIDNSISSLNEKLTVTEQKYKEALSRQVGGSTKDQTNTSSDIYTEYMLKQDAFGVESRNANNTIKEAESKLSRVNNELDKMSVGYKDRIYQQDLLIKKIEEQLNLEQTNIQQQISAGASKDNIDKSNLSNLQQQLEIEQKKKATLESEYSLAVELQRYQKIQSMSEKASHIAAYQPLANRGVVSAQNEVTNTITEMEKLSRETGINFGQVQTSINASGKEIKTVLLDLREINTELNKHPNVSADAIRHQELISDKAKYEKILGETKLPDESVYYNTQKEYAEKLKASFIEEQRLYNEELQKTNAYTKETGELTEKAENHLLNMYRYMKEYGQVAGVKKDQLYNAFGLDKTTRENLNAAWTDAQSRNANIQNSSIAVDKEVQELENACAVLREEIRLKEASKDSTLQNVNALKSQLNAQESELSILRQKKMEEVSRVASQKKANELHINQLSNTEKVDTSNISVENKTNKLKELEQVDNQVTQTIIANEQIVQQKENETASTIQGTTNVLKEQKNIVDGNTTASTTTASVIETQQQNAQNKILETDQMLQQQVDQAVQAARVSIAEGSYVNIAGSVKLDEGQFKELASEISNISSVSYNLLSVIQNIYAVISNGTPKAVNDIQSISAPLEGITSGAQEASNAIDGLQVKLSNTSKRLEVVAGGDVNIGTKEFSAVQNAVDKMNQIASNNAMLKEIMSSGDITAKYFTKGTQDGTQEFVRLNSVFKDTEGRIIQVVHEYDVAANKMKELDGVSVKLANNFTLQNQAMREVENQMKSHLSKLDDLKIKYQVFDINNFGIDENGNLFAKMGTQAEQVFGVIQGNTKKLIKDVITQMSEVETKFLDLQEKASKGILSPDDFTKMSKDLNLSIDKLETSMNAVNRQASTQLEHKSRSFLSSWEKELATASAYMYQLDGTQRIDTTNMNAQGLSYIEQYKTELSNLEKMYVTLREQGTNFTEEQVNNWKRQLQTINDLKKNINSNSSKSYVNGSGKSIDNLSLTEDQFSKLTTDANYARNVLKGYAQDLAGTQVQVLGLSKDNRVLTYSFKDQENNINTCKLSVDDYGRTIRNTSVSSKKHVGLLSGAFADLKGKIMQIMRYFSAYRLFYKFINAVRNGINTVKEFDKTFTQMSQVSDKTTRTLRNFQAESFNVAKALGTTSKQIQQSTVDWLRLGESFEQATESAKASTMLLNISDFESIDEATKSLVSMSAAYGDLTKTDIVDKLAYVGNHYSISTQELATAMQASASSLTTAGNDMDQAAAIITAGNAVVQDASKVGSGIRTIALRITGTKEAQEELEELGETTDDFVIRTASKTQDTIKNFTKVASNNFKGFDILDDNGNYKSTYDILLGIAEIYDEIVESDKKYGSNMANGLLETLAGKNRSNIAASILQNKELLESVYESSASESEGSSQDALDKYVASIEGKTNQFKNEVEEFWFTLIDTDTIKFFVDAGTTIVDILGKITSKIGILGTVAASIGTVFGFSALKTTLKSGGRTKKFVLIA